jgi:hypothetical protein
MFTWEVESHNETSVKIKVVFKNLGAIEGNEVLKVKILDHYFF